MQQASNEADQPDETQIIDSLFERGDYITQAVFDPLRNALMSEVKTNGFTSAISFCNLQALPIAQHMEQEYNISIRRATDRPRNPLNEADALEMQQIQAYRDSLSQDAPPRPIVVSFDEESGQYHYFKPIFTMSLCLNCHGIEGETLRSELDTTLARLYPGDRAIGYQDKELRGIWHITFDVR
jgi:hypothetical protein